MKIDAKVVARLEELIKAGQRIEPLRVKHSNGAAAMGTPVDAEESSQWGVSCLNILSRVFGKDSDHYQRFDSLYPKLEDWTAVRRGVGIIKAAKDDYKNDYLFDTRVMIHAEVFDDFLGQAQYLLENGYYAPAAVVAGSVLEDGLRKLCARNDIPLSERPKLESMNADLVKAGVYNLLTQKQITALSEIRNNAAHGHWHKFAATDVRRMIDDVRSFMTNYFS